MKRQSHNAKLYTQFDPNYVKAYTKRKKYIFNFPHSTFTYCPSFLQYFTYYITLIQIDVTHNEF